MNTFQVPLHSLALHLFQTKSFLISSFRNSTDLSPFSCWRFLRPFSILVADDVDSFLIIQVAFPSSPELLRHSGSCRPDNLFLTASSSPGPRETWKGVSVSKKESVKSSLRN